jgi:hypothetical protein
MIRNFICISMLMVPYIFFHSCEFLSFIHSAAFYFISFHSLMMLLCLIQTYAIACFSCPEFSTPADVKKLERYQRQFAVRNSLVIGPFRMPIRCTGSYAKALECLKQRILRKRRHHFNTLFFFSLC